MHGYMESIFVWYCLSLTLSWFICPFRKRCIYTINCCLKPFNGLTLSDTRSQTKTRSISLLLLCRQTVVVRAAVYSFTQTDGRDARSWSWVCWVLNADPFAVMERAARWLQTCNCLDSRPAGLITSSSVETRSEMPYTHSLFWYELYVDKLWRHGAHAVFLKTFYRVDAAFLLWCTV